MFKGLFQPAHLFLVLGVAFLVFGPKRIAQLGSSLGKSVKDFKKAISPDKDVIDITPKETPRNETNRKS